MPYLAVSEKTYTVSDTCGLGTYAGKSKTATVKISVDTAGTLTWKVSMASDDMFKGSFYLNIAGNTLYDAFYKGTSSSDVCGNGYYNTGTLTVSAGSVAIDIRLCSGQDFHSSTDRFNGTNGNTETTIKKDTITVVYYTNMSAGTVTIKDNYNNSYTVTGTRGSTPTGDSNTVTGHKLCCATSSTSASGWDYVYETTNLSETVSFTPLGTSDYRRVAGRIITYGTYHSSEPSYSYKEDVRQYIGPTPPGTPVISYSKSKLTNKEPWTFTWTPALATNISSPVVGYRLRLYRNGNIINGIALKSGSKTELIKSGTEPLIDTNSTSCSITILDPTEFGFVPGDTVKLGIYSYTRFGQDNNDYTNVGASVLYNSDSSGTLEKRGTEDAHVFSLDYTVQKAGLLKVNTLDGWKEGQAFIKTENGWKEASSVFIKSEKGWKEPK